MPTSRSRTIAFDVLRRVEHQDAYADEALRAELGDSVKPEDAGLATELVFGLLRWQRLLDFLVDRRLKKPSTTLDPEVRIALRMGLYQLLFLDRIPARAAVNESVELVKRARKSSAASLVNAVLRKGVGPRPNPIFALALVEVQRAVSSLFADELSSEDRLGILSSHPTWMVERWVRTFGEGRARAIAVANNRVPALACYLLNRQHGEDAATSLRSAGCRLVPGQLLNDGVALEGGNPGASEAVRRGWVAIQDEASQAVAALLAVDRGMDVLDLCAAPGGKTLRLARAIGSNGRVIAVDLHEHRVRAMKERFELCGVQNVETIVTDATKLLPFERAFDRVLVDVPCSGTGTLARHPEIRWKLGPEDLRDLHERQTAILRNALALLAPEGRLVYSTCSLEPEENEDVVREVLDAAGSAFRIADPRTALQNRLQESVPVDSLVSGDGFFRTFPPQHGTDGFFAAVIERNGLKT